MKFGPCSPPEAAIGAMLAHTHRFPDAVLRKGTVLTPQHAALLRGHGVMDVVCARLEEGDVEENEAARRMGAMLVAAGLTAGRAAAGRVNLRAAAHGLVSVSKDAIDALNRIHPAITVATVADRAVLRPRDVAATVKIIPFAAPEAALRQAGQIIEAAAAAPLQLHAFSPRRVGLIMTTLPGIPERLLENVSLATQGRIAALGGMMLRAVRVPHAEQPIAEAARILLAEGADCLLIAGASAVVDPADVAPAAIVRLGGEVVHFGMPVDPGNLLCLCRIGSIPAVIMPGCARNPRLNGVDHVLHRLFAGLDTSAEHIMGMGVGGLLDDPGDDEVLEAPCDTQAAPVSRPRALSRAVPRIATIILAAGMSRRMQGAHKLLLPGPDGRAMIAHVADHALASRASEVAVVLGHRADSVQAALAGRDLTFVRARDYADGLSASLRAGVEAVADTADAVLVCLGDMPLVTTSMMDRLIGAFDPAQAPAVVPAREERTGNPVLWGARFFPDLLALEGDRGAAVLLARYRDLVCRLPVEDDACLTDFDTLGSLARWNAAVRA